MRRLRDVANARRKRAGVGAAERDDLQPGVEPEEPADERGDVPPDTGRGRREGTAIDANAQLPDLHV
jgi:hypothetical protein